MIDSRCKYRGLLSGSHHCSFPCSIPCWMVTDSPNLSKSWDWALCEETLIRSSTDTLTDLWKGSFKQLKIAIDLVSQSLLELRPRLKLPIPTQCSPRSRRSTSILAAGLLHPVNKMYFGAISANIPLSATPKPARFRV